MYAEFPILSSHDDDTLYLMISERIVAWDRWAIAVDMANMTLQDVAHYRRSESVRLKFQQSNISSHLNMGASSAARKRPGVQVLLESSRKKQCVLSTMDEMVLSWVCQQEQHQDAGTIKGAQYGDDMDLDMTTLLNEH
jgi:primase-polymerase (primpol)-like protein